jgi:hypothetical protein
MIYLYSDENLRKWNRGEFKVQLNLPNRKNPMGYCDGTDEDESEILSMAEAEGEEQVEIQKRILKTGREIWMLKTTSNAEDDEVDD